MKFNLLRFASDNRGILGMLCLENCPSCYTLELPYRENLRNVSAIPEGTYPCRIKNSPKRGKCVALENVPGRSDILIHAGNTIKDTQGCILVGTGCEDYRSAKTVTGSRDALESLLEVAAGKKDLEISILNIKNFADMAGAGRQAASIC